MKRTQLRRTPFVSPVGEDGKPVWSSFKPRSSGLALVDGRGAPVHPIRQQRRRNTGPTLAVRTLVLERDNYACVCCGVSIAGRPYSLQHRKRRSQGGDNSPSNLIVVLGTGTTACHERIDSRRNESDEAKGYTVRSWDDPEIIPVTLFTGERVWLLPDGRYSTRAPQGAA